MTMTAAGVRRARHPCSALVAVCAVLAATGPSAFGFQLAVPKSSSRNSSSSSRRGSRSERRASRPPVGRTHQAQQTVSAGIVLCEEGVRRSRRRGSALLSEREDSADDGGQEQQQVSEQQPPAEAQKATVAAAAAAAAPPVTVAAPRRYVGDGAGMGDEGGVGGPKGDGRGKEWTVDLCCKRLSLLHRKLRQVKSLQAQQARDPDSIDDAQLVKLRRKQNLVTEITELESLRRDLREKEWESGGSSAAPKKEKKSRLPPGPFAAINAGAGAPQQQQEEEEEEEGEEDDSAEYTRDGLRLASPKRQVQPPKPAPAAAAAAAAAAAGAAARQSTPQSAGGRQAAAAAASPQAFSDGDLFAAGAGGGADSDEGISTMAAALRQSMDGDEEDEGDGGFNWEEGYEDMKSPTEEMLSDSGLSGISSEVEEPDSARPMLEAPAGGYPKRLAGMMSFCRVSDKATCEILVEMGRVTVNGLVATDPGVKVDLLTDIVVANGVAVTFPGKIDNSDETKKPREDEGKRTGPIPKAEKNTWKQKTKYRWGMDDGLLAKRTRRAANAKSFEKKRRSGGGGYDDW